MKRSVILCLLFAGCLIIGSQARAVDVTGNLNLIIGQKLLPESDWKMEGIGDLSKQTEFGVLFDIRGKEWPINIAVDLLSSKKTIEIAGIDVDGKTSELALGVRKYFMEEQMVKPYLGGGLANIKGEISIESFSISDTKIGPWIDGGLKFNPVKQLNLGVDVRYSYAKTKAEEFKYQSGGWHWGIFAGWNF